MLDQLKIWTRDDIKTSNDMFLQYEKINYMMRLDETKIPTAFKCATVSSSELKLLRKVKNVIRKGRLQSLQKNKIVFQDNSVIDASTNYLYVDCTSNGLSKRPSVPIFNGKNICLQSVSQCQQVFSAAALGALEARFSDNDELMNKVKPVPHPEVPNDYVSTALTSMTNAEVLIRNCLGFSWIRSCRLNPFHHFSLMTL